MVSVFFAGVQQDLKLVLFAPIMCALFRLAFILIYGTEKSPAGHWLKWAECFRYGFWWGMDWNAYVYLACLLLVSVPGAFLPVYFMAGDSIRALIVTAWLMVLYTTFMGKMIFFYHFHDTFNQTLRLGKNADKMNFVDIFFHQNHGIWIIIGYVPYAAVCWLSAKFVLSTPVIAIALPEQEVLRYAIGASMFIVSVAFFYWLRYGGTFRHRKKPEWDEVPRVVKDDQFLCKAVIDDLIALENVFKHPMNEMLSHDDVESARILKPLMGKVIKTDEKPWNHVLHKTSGNRIKKPSHIFWLLGESHTQALLDPGWTRLNLMEASVKFRQHSGVVSINNCLPAGPISQPSLVSQIAGIYDDNMELNENVYFWKAGIPTSLPVQMRRLGYRSVFWYGGGLNWGSLEHFIPAIGFDDCHGGSDICPDDAPRTWLGVYDHIFLQNAERLIKQSDDGQPVLHFLYTTSNHGPYRMPMEELGFDAERILADAPDEVRNLRGIAYRQLGGIWYADQSLIHFAERMMEAYPDSLIIVTGDHAGGLPPYGHGVIPRDEATLRELRMPSFALYHRDLTWDMLAHNDLASHMAIMPTVMELIAPEGFEYLSISRPLTEHIDHVVTPYCWMDDERIGDYGTRSAQQLAPSLDPVPMENDIEKYRDERNALAELTGWVLRHPELLVTYR